MADRSSASSWRKTSAPARYWTHGFSTRRGHRSALGRSNLGFEDRKARHQPPRHAGAVATDLTHAGLRMCPVHGLSKPRQFVAPASATLQLK